MTSTVIKTQKTTLQVVQNARHKHAACMRDVAVVAKLSDFGDLLVHSTPPSFNEKYTQISDSS